MKNFPSFLGGGGISVLRTSLFHWRCVGFLKRTSLFLWEVGWDFCKGFSYFYGMWVGFLDYFMYILHRKYVFPNFDKIWLNRSLKTAKFKMCDLLLLVPNSTWRIKGSVQLNLRPGLLYIIRKLSLMPTIAGHKIYILLKGHFTINKNPSGVSKLYYNYTFAGINKNLNRKNGKNNLIFCFYFSDCMCSEKSKNTKFWCVAETELSGKCMCSEKSKNTKFWCVVETELSGKSIF